MVMVVAAALSLIATIFVAGAAGYVAVASRLAARELVLDPVRDGRCRGRAHRLHVRVPRGRPRRARRQARRAAGGRDRRRRVRDVHSPRRVRGGHRGARGSRRPARRGTDPGARARLARVRRPRDRRPDLRDLPAARPLGRAARGHALVDDRRPGRDGARPDRRPLPQVDLPRPPGEDPRPAARGDRRRRADRRVAAPARCRGVHRDGGLLGRRGVRPLGLPRRLRPRHAVGGGGRRRLRDRLRADAADAPARRRRRRRGAPAVRARLGRLQLARRRPRRLRLPGLQPLAAARPGGLRALPPAAASARGRRAASAGRRSRW